MARTMRRAEHHGGNSARLSHIEALGPASRAPHNADGPCQQAHGQNYTIFKQKQ